MTELMNANGLEVADREGIRTLKMARPPRNQLNPTVLDALIAAVADADDDPAVRVLVLTGSGTVFSDGIEKPVSAEHGADLTSRLARLLKMFPLLGTPVIAAVNGDALQGGYALACAADISVASADSRIGTLEASYGVWPALAQVPALKRMPSRWTVQNIMTGVPFTAAEALQHGLVNEVVDDKSGLPAAVDRWAEAISRSRITAAGRRAMYRMFDQTWDESIDAGFVLGGLIGRLPGA